jgi:hypothetical protein
VWPTRLLLAGAIIHGASGLAAAATPSEHEEPPAPGSQARAVDADERWPIEYVRRRQTLPARGLQMALSASRFAPDSPFRSRSGQPLSYYPSTKLVLGLAAGLTDRLQVGLALPAIVCVGQGEPSACSGYSRARGGLGVDFAVEPTGRAKLKVFGNLYLDRSSPTVFRGDLGARLKLLVGDAVALEIDGDWASTLNDPNPATPAPGVISLTFDNNLQVTRHLCLYGQLVPRFAPAYLDQGLNFGLFAGASYSFGPHVSLSAGAGSNNLRARLPWEDRLPGRSYWLTLSTWLL